MSTGSKEYSIGYLKTANIQDYELQLLESIFEKIKGASKRNISLISVLLKEIETKTKNFDILLVFSDTDLLTYVKHLRNEDTTVLCIELPGDNSFFAQTTLNGLQEKLAFLVDQEGLQQNKDTRFNHFPEKTYEVNVASIINARISYDVLVNSMSLFESESDSANSILISTPTGSTAMSLNIGGAIIHPKSKEDNPFGVLVLVTTLND